MVAAGEREIAEVGGDRRRAGPVHALRRLPAAPGRVRPRRDAGPLCGPEGLRRDRDAWASCCPWLSGRNLGAARPPRWRCRGGVRRRRRRSAPRVAVVLGSGLGASPSGSRAGRGDYADIPGFPRPSVQGHAGRLVLGRWAGVPVACCGAASTSTRVWAGRRQHAGRARSGDLAADALVLTNASGSLRPDLGAARWCWSRTTSTCRAQPARRGLTTMREGPRFVDMSEVYDPRLRAILGRGRAPDRPAAADRGLPRPARARASRPRPRSAPSARSAPTSSACRPCRRRSAPGTPGSRVAAISVVTNLAAGMAGRAAEPCATPEPRPPVPPPTSRDLLEAALPEIARAST